MFLLYEVDNLLFNTTLLIISLGILYNVFKLDFKSLADIFKLRINRARKLIRIRWKPY
jgi:hypothetical protein